MGGAALSAGVRAVVSKGAQPALEAVAGAARGEGKALADGLTKGVRSGKQNPTSAGGAGKSLLNAGHPAQVGSCR